MGICNDVVGNDPTVTSADFAAIVDRVAMCEASLKIVTPGLDTLREKITEVGAAVVCAKNASEADERSVREALSLRFGAIDEAIAAIPNTAKERSNTAASVAPCW